MPRGISQRTPERVAEAQRLRAQGLTYREIGERLGVSLQTAHGWISDPCAIEFRRIWTADAIVLAIQKWADEHGGVPPAATDWNTGWLRSRGRDERVEAFYAFGAPHTQTVLYVFGSWNAAIEAAGFEPRRASCYGREGEDMALCEEIAAKYRDGMSTYMLATEYGCTAPTIAYRIAKTGTPLRSHAEANAVRWAREMAA